MTYEQETIAELSRHVYRLDAVVRTLEQRVKALEKAVGVVEGFDGYITIRLHGSHNDTQL